MLMTFPEYYRQRFIDLESNINGARELLNDYEEELIDATDPAEIRRYKRHCEKLKQSIKNYQNEYDELKKESKGTPSPQMQKVGSRLQSMDDKLDILLVGQDALREDLLSQLNQNQLVLMQKLEEAVDANQVSELQMEQMLEVLKKHISSLPSNQAAIAEVIKNPESNIKQKIKVILPIIPLFVKYEGEIELGSGFNITSAWKQIVAVLQRS